MTSGAIARTRRLCDVDIQKLTTKFEVRKLNESDIEEDANEVEEIQANNTTTIPNNNSYKKSIFANKKISPVILTSDIKFLI